MKRTRKQKPNAIARLGLKQTYFVKPENIEKMKDLKKHLPGGYSDIINEMIEKEHKKLVKRLEKEGIEL